MPWRSAPNRRRVESLKLSEVLWFGRLAKQYGTLRCLNFVRCVRVGGSGADTRVKFDAMVSLSLWLNRKIREV